MLASVKSLDTKSCEKLIQYNYLSKCELILSKRINTLYRLMIESLGQFFLNVNEKIDIRHPMFY